MKRAFILLVALFTACSRDTGTPTASPNSIDAAPAPAPDAVNADLPDDPVFIGAGDIASCLWVGDNHTGQIIDSIPGTVFTLGDNVYQEGTAARYKDCYGPAWGSFKDRTYPALGNHDEAADSGASYYDYFGSNAGPRDKGYYSYDLGAWHIIVYNSNAKAKIADHSEQIQWIRDDLAAHAMNACILAYGHHPRFSSGERGEENKMKALWDVLYQGGVDVVLSGHEHFYERFSPQTPDGEADPRNGVRQFIVGTGGAPFYRIMDPAPNSEVRSRTHGVLKMRLHRDSYEWQFIPVAGESFTDTGRTRCSPPHPSKPLSDTTKQSSY